MTNLDAHKRLDPLLREPGETRHMRHIFLLTAKHVARILLMTLAGGFLALALTRLAPGVDEREFDTRLSEESRAAIRQSHEAEHNVFRFYWNWLRGAVRGDLGVSQALNRPVAELLSERLPVTARLLGWGLLTGWGLGLGLALPLAFLRGRAYDLGAGAVATLFLCVPAAVLALFFVLLRAPAALALGLLVFPKVFRYARTLLQQSATLPHVLTARAKGLSSARVLFWHYLPPAATQWLALLAVSITLALSAAVPVEVVCDLPGIGQLAWKAALARDLYLLVCLTGIVTLATVVAKSVSELLGETVRPLA
jgi:peptide/nickel transport system permease protein